ncbi:MAG: acyl-CoA dehydrogenase, partial [Thiotrichaceae bacterium]
IGGKLFTTLGTIADLYIMLAVVAFPDEDITNLDPRKRITAFIVEREYPGISVKPLSFCGWHGLPNAAIKLDKVRIPKQNRVGEVGDGLKIAFMNLGSGRINISAISLGMMKHLERVARWWGVQRVQGGKPIGEHELNTEQLVSMNACIYASEAFLQFVSALADQPDMDIRLEAAMLKLFSSHALVDIADETLQLRGGRGYESYVSQASRGDTAVAVERLFRSARMMKIGEGGSNVLKLYIMRCLLNDFLKDNKKIADQELSLAQRFFNLIKVSASYTKGYFQPSKIPKKNMPQPLYQHMCFVRKTQRRFNCMIIIKIIAEYLYYYRQIGINYLLKRPLQKIPKPETSFEQHQILLGHCAQIAMLLSVMTVTCQRAAKDANPEAIELADEFCIRTREKISIYFLRITNHSRKREITMNKRGVNIMNGNFTNAVEQNIFHMDLPNIRD